MARLVWVAGFGVSEVRCEFWVGSCLGGCSPECCCSLSFMCCLWVRRASLCGLCCLAVRFAWFLISEGCYRMWVLLWIGWFVLGGWFVVYLVRWLRCFEFVFVLLVSLGVCYRFSFELWLVIILLIGLFWCFLLGYCRVGCWFMVDFGGLLF